MFAEQALWLLNGSTHNNDLVSTFKCHFYVKDDGLTWLQMLRSTPDFM